MPRELTLLPVICNRNEFILMRKARLHLTVTTPLDLSSPTGSQLPSEFALYCQTLRSSDLDTPMERLVCDVQNAPSLPLPKDLPLRPRPHLHLHLRPHSLRPILLGPSFSIWAQYFSLRKPSFALA